jgi:hypothetical protein
MRHDRHVRFDRFVHWGDRLDDRLARRLGRERLDAWALSHDEIQVIAAWREQHPAAPWRGQDGRGGLVGWANRLDERFNVMGGMTAPRERSIRYSFRAVFREIVRSRLVVYLVFGVPLCFWLDSLLEPGLSGALTPTFILALWTAASLRVRRRRIAEMKAEVNLQERNL